MRDSLRPSRAVNGRHVVVALGAMYVGLAVLFPLGGTGGGLPFEIVTIVSVLTAAPGSVLLYGGYRLPRAQVHTVFYDRIAGWCLAGAGVMSGILVLNAIVNGLANVVPNVLILTALSSGAGFGIGLYDAKARTRAQEAEQRTRELVYHNDQLENFARLLAHELRNPLAIATGYHQQSRPRNAAAATKVTRAHERIEEMIDELLDTVERSKVNVDDRPILLAEVAPTVWDDLPVGTADATLLVESERTIRGNPIHVQQLLENLFRNSLEHGQAGVTVRIGDLEDGFFVEDDGPGIPDGMHEDAVEAGFTTREHGMGLGLTVVLQITDLYDWDWTLTDGERGGARMEFTNVQFVTART